MCVVGAKNKYLRLINFQAELIDLVVIAEDVAQHAMKCIQVSFL